MKRHLATALGALLLCLAGPALAQFPGGPDDIPPVPGGPKKVTDVSIKKSAVGTVIAGQTATFVLQVTNSGTTTIGGPGPGLIVSEYGWIGLQGPLNGSGFGWSCSGGNFSLQCTWVGGPVAPGAGFPPITVTLMAQEKPTYWNCARIEVIKGTDNRPANNQSCINGRIARPLGDYNASIRKDGPGTITYGQLSSFTIQVTNTGQSSVDAAAGLTVVDQVPSAFTGVTASGVGWTCNVSSSLVTCTYTGQPVGPNLQFPTITIQGKAGKIGSYLNCAGVEFRKVASNSPRDNKDCAEGVIRKEEQGYDVAIRKTWKAPKPGGPAVFSLQVYNNGPSPVDGSTGVQVTDTLPLNFQPPINGIGTDWTCATQSSGGGAPWTVTCDYVGPPVGVGPLPSIQINAAVAEGGAFRNCAEVSFRTEKDRNPRDNTGCVEGEVSKPGGKRPDVNITKTALKQPWTWPSGTGVYQFRITNLGDTPVPAGHTFTLTENLPAGMLLVATPGGWACAPGTGTAGPATILCNYSSTAALNPGDFIQFDMTVGFQGDKRPQYQNCASVAVSSRDGPWAEVNMDNNRDCEPVEVSQEPRPVDLGLQSNVVETFEAVNGGAFEFQVSGATALANGTQLVFNGSVSTPATLSPMIVTTPLWSCAGPWSGFACTINVSSGAFSGSLIPLRLKFYYSPDFFGQPLTFTGQIQMTGNLDPNPSNDSTSVTTVLP